MWSLLEYHRKYPLTIDVSESLSVTINYYNTGVSLSKEYSISRVGKTSHDRLCGAW
jgi:hypothetical protein